MEPKSLFASKTILIATLTFVAGVLTLASNTFGQFMTPGMAGAVLMALGVVNMIVRCFTSQPIA